MFGASESQLYLLIKSLLNLGRIVNLCVITKKKKKKKKINTKNKKNIPNTET